MTEEPPPSSPWRALIGLLALIAAMGGVWIVATQLRDAGRLQDCFAAGRTNCVRIEGG